MIGVAYSCVLFGSVEKGQAINQEALDSCEKTGFLRAMSAGLTIRGFLNDLFLGDPEQAQANYERAGIISQEMDQTPRLIDIECCLGHLWLGRRQPQPALTHFERAQSLGANTFNRRIIEAKSFQAVAYLQLGQLDKALAHTHQAIAQLLGRQHGLEAAQRLYLNHYQILLAWGQVDEAQTALITAHQMVLDQAGNLADVNPTIVNHADLKTQFLTRLPWNREIIAAWETLPFAR
jgi:tetratricopeptide (TPR) repeat protein